MSDAQRLAADPETSAFVTANAGSGKTTTLVSRVARLLLRGAAPETILCVTYTKAAAAEMQRRLFETLGAWALRDDAALAQDLGKLEARRPEGYARDELSRARTLFARALETPGGLKIQTIHAFCEKLLRRFPLEAGVSPGFQVLDDASGAQIAAEARDRVARRALAGEPLLADAYARFAVALDFAAFEAMFAAFEARRDAILHWIGRCGGLTGVPQAAAEAVGLEALEDAARIESEAANPPRLDLALWREVTETLRTGSNTDQGRAAAMAAICEDAAEGVAEFHAVLGVFCTKAGEPATWPEKVAALKARAGLQARWLEERERLFTADRRARAARVADDTVQAMILAWFYIQAHAEAKQARGSLDFTDLVSRTAQLLTGEDAAAWVLYKLDAGLEHILVDEAQDTAPDQWDILDRLTEEFYAGSGARERTSPRTAFVVGDEKQSIFSFQGAQPERLIQQREHYRRRAAAAERRFEAVPLEESWRSTPEVLAFVDAVFASEELTRALMPRRPPQSAVPTAPPPERGRGAPERDGGGDLIRHIANRDDGPGTIDLWPLEREEAALDRRAWDEPLDTEGRGAFRRLAEKIADEIRALVSRGDPVFDKAARRWRPADYGDVLILVRKRKTLFEEVLRACKRRGVPVAGADRLVLSEHPVFEDFLALARFCLFPDDDLTLAALLRSPFCDVDEDGLFALAHDREGSLWRTLARRGDERPEWLAARTFLGWARSEAAQRTPFDFYSRVLNRLDASGRSMARRIATRLGPEAGDAVEAYLAQALAAEARGVCDLERLADALARLNVTVKREMDEPRGEVRVMTAHGAKGLEAPIVFLPETVSAAGGRASPLLETEDGGFLWCGSKGGDCEASAAARAARDRREADESLRLLYVALTRTRDRLIVAGRVNATAKEENLKGWWGPLRDAFDRLGDEVRELPNGARRYGADPQSPSSSDHAQRRPGDRAASALGNAAGSPGLRADVLRPRMAVPDWALAPPAPEAASPTYAAPSTLTEDDPAPAPSPLARAGGLGRFRRGNLIHRLLQLLPDLPPQARAVGAERLLAKEADLSPEQRAEMAAAALAVLSDPAFADVFAPGSRPEAAVAGTAPELPPGLAVSGRVDRMRIDSDRVLVVDFKTNRPAPRRIEDVDPAYILQMAVYAAVLRAVFPRRRIEGALVWTDGPRLMPIPEAVMRDALARMKRGG
jgi:ATP-dependent helicase/nuclease subunit A